MRFINFFVFSGILFLAISCSKDEGDLGSVEDLSLKSTPPVDPVIERYSGNGTIELADNTYQPNESGFDGYNSVYLYYPEEGQFAGKLVEIYRYTDEEDIGSEEVAKCDLKKKEVEQNGKTIVYCPNTGTNCQEATSSSGHCVLIFCDETELL